MLLCVSSVGASEPVCVGAVRETSECVSGRSGGDWRTSVIVSPTHRPCPSNCRAHLPASAAGERDVARKTGFDAVWACLSVVTDGDSDDRIHMSVFDWSAAGGPGVCLRAADGVSDVSFPGAFECLFEPQSAVAVVRARQTVCPGGPGKRHFTGIPCSDVSPLLRPVPGVSVGVPGETGASRFGGGRRRYGSDVPRPV